MILPKMICFDYGETLVHEEKFEGRKGYAEILKYAEENKYHRTAEELANIASEINDALGRFDIARRHLFQIEVPDTAFQAYLLESQGIKLSVPYPRLASAFWEAAAPGTATDGIEEFLTFLRTKFFKLNATLCCSNSEKCLCCFYFGRYFWQNTLCLSFLIPFFLKTLAFLPFFSF